MKRERDGRVDIGLRHRFKDIFSLSLCSCWLLAFKLVNHLCFWLRLSLYFLVLGNGGAFVYRWSCARLRSTRRTSASTESMDWPDNTLCAVHVSLIIIIIITIAARWPCGGFRAVRRAAAAGAAMASLERPMLCVCTVGATLVGDTCVDADPGCCSMRERVVGM